MTIFLVVVALASLLFGGVQFLARRRSERARADAENELFGVRATVEQAAQQQRYQQMVERSTDIISLLAPDGSIMYITPSAGHVLGYPDNMLVGQDFFRMVHEEDRPLMEQLWKQLLETPGSSVSTPEFRFMHRDGSWRYLESIGRNLIDDPEIRGILANSHDVTERRQALDALRLAEEQFRQSQKMEAVGRLAGGIAHDFNNLLTAILGYTRLLLDRMPEDAGAGEDLDQIRQNAERAAALTRQLLAFSRRQMLQPRPLDLNAVVLGLQSMLSRLIGEHITIEPNLAPDLAPVLADAGQLEQVIMNLVVNARDAMPDGGVIRITTSNTSLTPEFAATHRYPVIPGEYVELLVTDTGTGIPDEVLPSIFEPFFTTKEPGKGTGLGLSTVYGVVKQSGGYIWMHSTEGKGTTVRICLPVTRQAPEPMREAPVTTSGSAGGETILVVEDEDAVRTLACRLLERAGYRVLSAANGPEAIDVCETYDGHIDMVFTDVVMPGMNGRELVDRLEVIRPGIRSLYASGYTRDAIIERGVVDSDIDFIEKPFEAAALTRKVRQILDDSDAVRTAPMTADA